MNAALRRTRPGRDLAYVSLILGLLGLVVPILAGLWGGLDLLSDFDSDLCLWSRRRGVEAEALGLAFLYGLVLLSWLALSLPFAIPAVIVGIIALVRSRGQDGGHKSRQPAIWGVVCGILACVPPHVQLTAPKSVGRAIARRLCEAQERRYARSSEGVFHAALERDRDERGGESGIRALLDEGVGEALPPESVCKAISSRAGVVAEWLVDNGADPNAPYCIDFSQPTPLGLAVQQDMADLVEHMLARGADPNQNGAAASPLVIAVAGADPRIVEMLLSRGARIEDCPVGQRPPLETAVTRGEPRIVSLLLAGGARVDARCQAGRFGTTLHAALAWDRRPRTGNGAIPPVLISQIPERVAVVELLLEYGADPTARGGPGTPLQVAARSNFIEGAEKVLDRCEVLECVATPGQLRGRKGRKVRTAVDLAREERQRCCDVPPGAGAAWRRGSASLAADHDRMIAMLEAWERRVRQHAAVAPTEAP